MAALANLLPFRHALVSIAIGVAGTALLAAAFVAIPFVIVRSKMKAHPAA